MLSFGNIIIALALWLNGIAILNEQRFLIHIGLAKDSSHSHTHSHNFNNGGKPFDTFGNANPYAHGQSGYGSADQYNPYGSTGGTSTANSSSPGIQAIRRQLIDFIYAIRTVFRIPLVVVNCLLIIFELLFG